MGERHGISRDWRVIYLHTVQRPARKLISERPQQIGWSVLFTKYPPLSDLTSAASRVAFGVGKFAGSQIQELRKYGDGVIIEPHSNSKILDAFVDDLFEWHQKELGLFQRLRRSRSAITKA